MIPKIIHKMFELTMLEKIVKCKYSISYNIFTISTIIVHNILKSLNKIVYFVPPILEYLVEYHFNYHTFQ